MFRHRVMVEQTLILFLTLSFGYVRGQDVVQLAQDIHGTTMTTRNGRTISAYLGIPYAEPPVGTLRFSAPMPYKPRNGAIQADKYGNVCPQMQNGAVIGDEDCLVLNVFTPKIDQSNPYPVMVYFHGGNYVRGSSNDAAPDYLLDKDIVLVTVNYRLGALGWLGTADEVVTGNNGLRDQALALEWVRMNILSFGGRPNLVTIFGQDAGAASTIMLAVSERTQGLFDQYIAQSGTPIAYWAFSDEFHDHYSQHATALGKYVKCPTEESAVLVDCLRSVDASTIVDSDDIFNNGIWKYRTWAPTTEPLGLPGTFLTNAPGELAIFKENWIKDCPAILGYVNDEGLLLTAGFYTNDTLYNTISGDLDAFLIPLVDNVAGDGHPKETEKKVVDFYFPSSVENTDRDTFTTTMTKIITDSSFTFPEDLDIWMMGEIKSPFYVYKFNYRGSYSGTSDIMGNDDDVGVTHGDDLTYLFPLQNATTKSSDSDEKMIDIMVDFWTSFAYGGAPTSQKISDPNMWRPFMENEAEKRLEIGEGSDPSKMSLSAPLEDKRFLFWNQITIGELFESLAG